MAEERRETIERAWVAAWDRGEVDALDELMAEGYRRHGDGLPLDLAGLKASITATRSAFPDLVTTIDEIVVDGDRAAIRRARGEGVDAYPDRHRPPGHHRDRHIGVFLAMAGPDEPSVEAHPEPLAADLPAPVPRRVLTESGGRAGWYLTACLEP